MADVLTVQEVKEPVEAVERLDLTKTDVGTDGEVEKTAEQIAEEEQAAVLKAAELDKLTVDNESEKEDELVNLRQIAREQKRTLETLEAELAKTNKLLEQTNLVSDEDKEKQAALQYGQQVRAEQLQTLLDVMEMNPKYEDVSEVVNQAHFDDVVESMANALVAKNGGNVDEVRRGLEAEIWSLRNPYKYMYGMIKQYHPAYAKAPEVKPGEVVKGKEPIKTATSIQDLPGGGAGATSGWTAAKIDALPEIELSKVPNDIYDKYLRNELK